MPVLTQLDPPGGVKDLASPSCAPEALVATRCRIGSTPRSSEVRDSAPKPQFYNPLVTPTDPAAPRRRSRGSAFLKCCCARRTANGRLAYQRADRKVAVGQERNHDEYLEWHVTRDVATGSIVRIVFTT
jgi:hypothetical protein